ncbi:MAG: HRDC domain-containing protein [Gemmatimonadota bacterium]
MHYVDTALKLERAVEVLRQEPLVAADSEAAGYHRYLDRLCLLQLSTRNETYLLDTFALEELGPLGPLLADRSQEVVFHDADYDLRLLDRDFSTEVHGLFDTKIAAQFLGEPALGLANLLESHVGVRLEKKYQRADWARRPLPADMLEYAAEDTRHLPVLRDVLRERLEAAGRLAWAEEEFLVQEQARWAQTEDGDAYLRMKGARTLTRRQLAALRELHAWRERQARALDRATFRVVSNEALVELARRMPSRSTALEKVHGITERLARRYGDELMSAVDSARAMDEKALPVRRKPPRRPPRDPELDARVDRLKSVRDRCAEELDLDRGFLMPRSQLEALALCDPDDMEELAAMEGVRRWQVEALGADLLVALDGRGRLAETGDRSEEKP